VDPAVVDRAVVLGVPRSGEWDGPEGLEVVGEEVREGAFAAVRAMVVRFDVRLDVKARTGEVVACGGHKIGGGSLGMVRLRAEEVTAMVAYLRRTKVRRQEHSFDERLYPMRGVYLMSRIFSAKERNLLRNVWTPPFFVIPPP
jgi:hypothetical protein